MNYPNNVIKFFNPVTLITEGKKKLLSTLYLSVSYEVARMCDCLALEHMVQLRALKFEQRFGLLDYWPLKIFLKVLYF